MDLRYSGFPYSEHFSNVFHRQLLVVIQRQDLLLALAQISDCVGKVRFHFTFQALQVRAVVCWPWDSLSQVVVVTIFTLNLERSEIESAEIAEERLKFLK